MKKQNSGLLEELQANVWERYVKRNQQEVIESTDRALREIREEGEARVSIVILEKVRDFLNEEEIPFIESKVDEMTWDIILEYGIGGGERP